MATLGSQLSPTGRDRAHQELGLRRAEFNALLQRRGINDYTAFQNQLAHLNTQIQNLRGANAGNMLAHGGAELARQDMERFFDEFLARVEANPAGIHGIAQAINPNINIQRFQTSPAREFGQRASQQVIEELRQGQGPFDALRVAVDASQNTDLYVLFSLFAAARAARQNAQNPQNIQANNAQLQQLEQQRAHLMRVNDELVNAHREFDTQETTASLRTWGCRAPSATVGAVATSAVALALQFPAPKGQSNPSGNNTPVNVTANIQNSVNHGHNVSQDAQGNTTLTPLANNSTVFNGNKIQLNGVIVKPNGDISGKLKYKPAGGSITEIDVKKGENTLADGKKVTLERSSNGKLKMTYDGTSVEY